MVYIDGLSFTAGSIILYMSDLYEIINYIIII